MAVPDLGRWEPLSLTATIETLSDAPFRWWLTGGHALDMHVGRSWRDHDDTDVGIARRDASAFRFLLAEWDIHTAAAGQLEPWSGDEPQAPRLQNNLWCRHDTVGPWLLDVTIGEGDDDVWIFRRDPCDPAGRRLTGDLPTPIDATAGDFARNNAEHGLDIDASTAIPQWGGESLDLGWAVTSLWYANHRNSLRRWPPDRRLVRPG
jgi:hypothetical protein